jgi:NAD(P)-dependent dehydrogenase (short-subunit alcohol dehydrogenase family)
MSDIAVAVSEPDTTQKGPFAGRIALVTGASRGIGRAAAMALAEAGAHVVAAARTVGALEEFDDEVRAKGFDPATLVPVDLRDAGAIDRLGAAIAERWGRLDVLVGAAGLLGAITPLPHLEPKVWDEVMAVNVTANWRLIRSLDPLLRQSDSARALFLSSGAARNCRPYWGVYSVSKAALEALVRTYAAEVKHSRIRVNLIDPGPTRTGMRAAAMPGEDPTTLPTPESLTPKMLEMLSADFDRTAVLWDRRRAQYVEFG